MAKGINYYILDSETSGLSEKIHEVVEISIIRAIDKMQLTQTIRAEHPETASIDALRITGKTLHDIKQGMSKEEAVKEFEDFLSEDGSTPNGRCIIAHNQPFDMRFLHKLWDKCNKDFPANLWIDTIQLTKDYQKKNGLKGSAKLASACDLMGIKKVAGLHNAKSDTRNCYLLWKKFMDAGIDHLQFIKNIPHREIEEDPNDLMEESD